MIVMIGPQLTCISSQRVCYKSRQKEYSFRFHKMLYEDYVRDPSFVKPDLVVAFNVDVQIYKLQIGFFEETWSEFIRLLANQNCPFILTCYTRLYLESEIKRIDTILDRKVEYLYCGKNPFASLISHRDVGSEKVIYANQYIIVYRGSLFVTNCKRYAIYTKLQKALTTKKRRT
ncbi:PREDICTED: uncharacterized protein LOC105558678 [Vollenhovia emeryi]|uniref:uncharacterized protein LOC105558678 n=1 Tax=Vollenhovia emeryi TaxID=411798 RepID=UPI0005F4F3E1|nr:PREDICTED: uncharacterized protein LOC105558678 [Vollenhovia emeryi]